MFGDGRRKKNKDKPKTISMKASGNQEILKFWVDYNCHSFFPTFLRFMCLWASGSVRMFSLRQWRLMHFSEALDPASRLLWFFLCWDFCDLVGIGGIFRIGRRGTRSWQPYSLVLFSCLHGYAKRLILKKRLYCSQIVTRLFWKHLAVECVNLVKHIVRLVKYCQIRRQQ